MSTPKFPNKQSLDPSDFVTDIEEEEIIRDMNRRGSNVSLSRFRSCPQLLEEDGNISSQAFESVADDSVRTNQNRSRSPRLLRRFQLDQIAGAPGSATPTPPSTPRSRRSFISQKESPSTPNQGLSPASTPRMKRRNHVFPSSSRGSSFESNKSLEEYKPCLLNEENLQKHEVLVNDLSKTKLKTEGSKIEDNQPDVKGSSKVGHGHHYHGDDLQSKCEMWLQTINISQTDKIKSRSQMQLHPVS